MNAREILAKNLIRLMTGHDRYRSRQAIEDANVGVSARTVGYMREGKGNPTLESIEAVATLFKLEAWELLIDHGEARKRILAKLLDSPGVPDERMERHGFKKSGKIVK